LDNLKLTYRRDYSYYVISSRTVSLEIRRGLNRISLYWEPGLKHVISASLGYDTFSDDNNRWEAILSPLYAFRRTEKYNLDLGLTAVLFGFDDDFDHGYYDPDLYQSYMATAILYLKIDDNNGVSITGAAGVQNDDDMDDFRSGYNIDIEGTFGIFRDWMLKVRAGGTHNLRQETGAFKAYILGLSLTRRF
jgi:hypothetical protein